MDFRIGQLRQGKVMAKHATQATVFEEAVWLRLVLPDTSSIALDKLSGLEPVDYAGLEDGVDWHWGRILTGAVLPTMLGVGSELAVTMWRPRNFSARRSRRQPAMPHRQSGWHQGCITRAPLPPLPRACPCDQ